MSLSVSESVSIPRYGAAAGKRERNDKGQRTKDKGQRKKDKGQRTKDYRLRNID